MKNFAIVLIIVILASCRGNNQSANTIKTNEMKTDTADKYGRNRDFLKRHVQVVELKKGNSAISIIPAWQARVMTSTAEGDEGFSFGWINRKHIESGKLAAHINAFGGEERLWLGPEGGQYSIFFPKGKQFVYDNWQTPAFIDTDPFTIISESDTAASFATDVVTENYSGTSLKLRIERDITLLNASAIKEQAGVDISGVNFVAYRSDNRLINKGADKWSKKTGLLSIWMLGMFNPSPDIVVTIPVKEGKEEILGPLVNDSYFGKISADRLKVKGNNIFFRADGKSRGKIGIPPLRAKGVMGSYDSKNGILTLLICRQPEGQVDYVNSAWELQKNPFSGDALNSYNDGPLADGTQMGPFYELETSSPAAELKPGESLSHTQYTIHLTGDKSVLNKLSLQILGVGTDSISKAF